MNLTTGWSGQRLRSRPLNPALALLFWLGAWSGWWHERTGPLGLFSEFSFQAFATSACGIFIIAAGAISTAASLYYAYKLFKKTGEGWWF